MIFALSSVLLRSHLDCYVQFWPPQYRTDIELLKGAQRKAMTVVKGLEYLSFKDRLREPALFYPEQEMAQGHQTLTTGPDKLEFKCQALNGPPENGHIP